MRFTSELGRLWEQLNAYENVRVDASKPEKAQKRLEHENNSRSHMRPKYHSPMI